MSESIPGGAYLDPDGKTFRDANGNVLDSSLVRELKALQRRTTIVDAKREAALREDDAQALADAEVARREFEEREAARTESIKAKATEQLAKLEAEAAATTAEAEKVRTRAGRS